MSAAYDQRWQPGGRYAEALGVTVVCSLLGTYGPLAFSSPGPQRLAALFLVLLVTPLATSGGEMLRALLNDLPPRTPVPARRTGRVRVGVLRGLPGGLVMEGRVTVNPDRLWFFRLDAPPIHAPSARSRTRLLMRSG